jgi:hypothetical protein
VAGLVHAAPNLAGVSVQHDPVGLEEVLELPRVLPPPADRLRAHPVPVIHEVLDGVGDLELSAPRRLDRGSRLEHRRREDVDPGQRQVRDVLLRLLDQLYDAVTIEDGHAETLRLRDLDEEDLSVGAVLPVGVHETADALGKEVVPQIHHEVVVVQVVAAGEEGMGQPQRSLLADVGHAHTEATAVPDGPADLLLRVPDDDPDVLDPGIGHGAKPVEEDGLVGNGDELLRLSVCDRPEPASGPSRQDEALHVLGSIPGRDTPPPVVECQA